MVGVELFRTDHISVFTASRQENVRFLIQSGAQLNARNKEDNVINAISKNVPWAMDEFKKLLDSGITIDRDKAIIHLDFTKIFLREKMKQDTLETSLFFDLSQTQFKDLIAHPLCQTFIEDKWIWNFVFFIMLPHFIFSLIYSFHSGLLFGYLCEMNDTDGRWEAAEEIPCGPIDDTMVRLLLPSFIEDITFQLQGNIATAGRLMLITCLFIYLSREIITMIISGCQVFRSIHFLNFTFTYSYSISVFHTSTCKTTSRGVKN